MRSVVILLITVMMCGSLGALPDDRASKPTSVDRIAGIEFVANCEAARQHTLQLWQVEFSSHPAFVKATDSEGRTLLHRAVLESWNEGVEWLLEHGAQVNALDNTGSAPIHCATSRDILRRLFAHGANADLVPHSGRSLLVSAVDSGYIWFLDSVLNDGHPADLDYRGGTGGYTALSEAARRGDLRAVRLLLAYGCDATVLDSRGRTAAQVARENGYPRVATLVQSVGNTPSISDVDQIIVECALTQYFHIQNFEIRYDGTVRVNNELPDAIVFDALSRWGYTVDTSAHLELAPMSRPVCVSIDAMQWQSPDRVHVWCSWSHACWGSNEIDLRRRHGRWVLWHSYPGMVSQRPDPLALNASWTAP